MTIIFHAGEMSTWSDILFMVANGTQICKKKKAILLCDHIIYIALSPTHKKLNIKLPEHNWVLTHLPIRVNGAVFQGVLELSIVSQSCVKSPDWFFFSSSKQTYVSRSYLRLDATNPAAVTGHLPPALLSWSIFCWNSHLSSWLVQLPPL